jgi:hypothetical protein
MTIELDILRSVLRAAVTHDFSTLQKYDQAAVNAHRGLLLRSEFAFGAAYSPEVPIGKAFRWEYSISSLAFLGERLLNWLSDDGLFQRAFQAYTESDCSWSLPALYGYLQAQADETRNA